MKIAVCEDQVAQSDLLNIQIKNKKKKKDINISIDNFATAESFLFQWSDYNKYDVIFLDIKMAKMSGIE
ncbi:MAG: DNA-binding response regulator, partial [Peptostreptococcaceae bacterium]|nr:DNA-binding response regulator [Peptostreptococcaceae bacterium]